MKRGYYDEYGSDSEYSDYEMYDSDGLPEDFDDDNSNDVDVAFDRLYGDSRIGNSSTVEEVHLKTREMLFNSSLKNMCLNVLIENLRNPVGSKNKKPVLLENNQTHAVATLPPNLKQMLLKKLMKANYGASVSFKYQYWSNETVKAISTHDICSMICELLGPRISEFSFEWMGGKIQTSHNHHVEKLYRLLASKYRDCLYHLIQGKEGNISKRYDYELSLANLQSVTHLKNLQHLELHENALNDLDFRRICRKLPNLQYLSCELLDVTQAVLNEALGSLSRLEVFIFKGWARKVDVSLQSLEEVDTAKLNGFCLDKFPQLKIIGAQVGGERFFEKQTRITFHQLKKNELSTGGPHQLQHLSIKSPLAVEQALRLPHVTSLRVSLGDKEFDSTNIGALLKFDKLRVLTVMWPAENSTIDKNLLLQLLQIYGLQLESLTLITYPRHDLDVIVSLELSMDEIHALCPNLERLSLDHDFTRGFDYRSILHPNTIKNLTKISITAWDDTWSMKVLSQLFTAPVLESLCLWELRLSEWKVKDLVENKKVPECISPKLREFRGSIHHSRHLSKWNKRILAHYWCLHVDLICATAPAFMTVDFDYGDKFFKKGPSKITQLMQKRARIL
ncbi:uncharacterized protein LOC132194824 [Neocloeon triangulifer]|uniref:uncharacterized protein LOC132194824 n=1 Tax=Neocloeon triangulifer TaxID=2078957 RepID=UPI00286F2E30|nr:uncharacterized protein LOC132194824 [Neocloeon triangulifer]